MAGFAVLTEAGSSNAKKATIVDMVKPLPPYLNVPVADSITNDENRCRCSAGDLRRYTSEEPPSQTSTTAASHDDEVPLPFLESLQDTVPRSRVHVLERDIEAPVVVGLDADCSVCLGALHEHLAKRLRQVADAVDVFGPGAPRRRWQIPAMEESYLSPVCYERGCGVERTIGHEREVRGHKYSTRSAGLSCWSGDPNAATAMPNHVLGHTAQEKALRALAIVCSDDDEVSVQL